MITDRDQSRDFSLLSDILKNDAESVTNRKTHFSQQIAVKFVNTKSLMISRILKQFHLLENFLLQFGWQPREITQKEPRVFDGDHEVYFFASLRKSPR